MRYVETERFWTSQLDLREVIPDYAAWQDRHEALSAAADRLGEPARIATGPDPRQALWVTPTGRPTHALVSVHGGQWSGMTARSYAFVAETAVAADATFFNVDYRPLQEAAMADVVADVAQAIALALSRCERVVVVGHAEGARLAVDAALRGGPAPAAVVAISGVYDLDPLRFGRVAALEEITAEEVAAYSPILRAGDMPCPLHLVAGAEESFEFRRQSARMFEAVRESGRDATLAFVPRRHHSSVAADLADPATDLSLLVQTALR